jgi:hypothetical protein
MKRFSRFGVVLMLISWVVAAGCRKETKKKEVATVAQDTMLLHDLAEANRNTAAAEVADNSLTTINSPGLPVPSGQTPQNLPGGTALLPPSTTGTQPTMSRPRMTVPRRANDAPAPTNIPLERSPASGDFCDSPAPADQRSCLNRSIVANDADLNQTYQELVAQSRISGGPGLEERIRQTPPVDPSPRPPAVSGRGLSHGASPATPKDERRSCAVHSRHSGDSSTKA